MKAHTRLLNVTRWSWLPGGGAALIVHIATGAGRVCADDPGHCAVVQAVALQWIWGVVSGVLLVGLLLRWRRWRRSIRGRWQSGMLLSGFVLATLHAWPGRAAAGCGPTDPGYCINQQIVSLQVSVQELLWTVINRPLLQLTRVVEASREWLIRDVFGSAFDATVAGVQFPFWIIAGVAWCVFAVCFFLQMVVELHLVNLKRGIMFLGLAIFLFNVGSQMLAWTEDLRVTVGSGFGSLALTSGTNASDKLNLFANPDQTLRPPTAIYAADTDNPCPFPTARATTALFMNDYAATFLAANAVDIHCPETSFDGHSLVMPALPHDYGEAGGTQDHQWAGFAWQFANPSSIHSEALDEHGMTALIQETRAGITRQFQGTFLCLVALLEQLMHLLFALALGIVWLGILISMLFVLFLPTEHLFTSQLRSIFDVLQASWKASVLLGILMSLLFAAAESGNSGIVFGIGLLLVLLTIALTVMAGRLLFAMVRGSFALMGQAPRAVGGALKGAVAGAAVGAVAGYTALKATGSKPYAFGTALGRVRPLRTALQAATATGLVNTQSSLVLGAQTGWAPVLDWSTQRRHQANRTRLAAAPAPAHAAGTSVDGARVVPAPLTGNAAEPVIAGGSSRRHANPVAEAIVRPPRPLQPMPMFPTGAGTTQRASRVRPLQAARLRPGSDHVLRRSNRPAARLMLHQRRRKPTDHTKVSAAAGISAPPAQRTDAVQPATSGVISRSAPGARRRVLRADSSSVAPNPTAPQRSRRNGQRGLRTAHTGSRVAGMHPDRRPSFGRRGRMVRARVRQLTPFAAVPVEKLTAAIPDPSVHVETAPSVMLVHDAERSSGPMGAVPTDAMLYPAYAPGPSTVNSRSGRSPITPRRRRGVMLPARPAPVLAAARSTAPGAMPRITRLPQVTPLRRGARARRTKGGTR